ncbi:Alkanesulfonate monooxygenase [Streptomyces sp. YIM 121038]|uniref:LLM class flavin-dependent oxidoreductase n=1 Tax=Streptomyces sp. YIM 121038 TaxID=2136401 RepID=UPI0011638DD3|nr:LLM class flavin-dependent oxidoreductase [Streptomyces sp. YIM 121038]QCX81926.1 Alkanesulfonate monooxygenase [Streptomyces sp. YIM 121038]
MRTHHVTGAAEPGRAALPGGTAAPPRRSMRHGVVILPEHPWPRARDLWRRAEELGFDHAWTFDHLMWRRLRESTWYSGLTTLTAAAAVTTRLRLGTLVASPNLRHPVSFAKELMTLDDISEGRLICGVGAGAQGFDAEVFGAAPLSPAERAARFEEFVELTDLLLREAETSYSGRYFQAREAHMHPGCVQRPRVPFALAAGGPRGMRLAARHAQSWITVGVPGRFQEGRFDRMAGLLEDQLARIDEACAAEGREPSTLARIVVAGEQLGGVLESAQSFTEAREMFSGMGFTDMVVFWPRADFPFAGRPEVLDAIAPLLHEGADTASRHTDPTARPA